MATSGMNANKLLERLLLAGDDRPIRISLVTSPGGSAVDSMATTVEQLSAPITFTPSATTIVWTGFGEDVPDEVDED